MRDNPIIHGLIPLAENLIHVPDLKLYLGETKMDAECKAAFEKAHERNSRIEI